MCSAWKQKRPGILRLPPEEFLNVPERVVIEGGRGNFAEPHGLTGAYRAAQTSVPAASKTDAISACAIGKNEFTTLGSN